MIVSLHGIMWFVMLVTAILACGATEPAKSADIPVSLDVVIDKVCQNEALYENIDVSMHTKYENLKEPPKDEVSKNLQNKPGFGLNNFREYSRREYDTLCVRQNGMFRTEMTGKSTFADNTASDDKRMRMFDGEKTRVAVGNSIGNIIAGCEEGGDLLRPHMFLLRPMKIVAPLSTYLQGHKAMAACPTAAWQPHLTLENTYQGEAEFQGLKCRKVWITTLSRGKPHDRWELWLAEERNYIPARLVAYTFRFSKDISVGEGTVKQWRQLASGVWFPLEIRITAFDKLKVQREGKQSPIWQQDDVAQKVSLQPKYDESFFSELKFDDGAVIYKETPEKRVEK